MAEQDAKPSGPDLSQGVAFTDLADGGMLLGHVGGEQVVLARTGAELFAIGASCSHYHGPLAEGLLVGDTVRCPWHHACFSLRTGEALAAPAITGDRPQNRGRYGDFRRYAEGVARAGGE
jgi:nitrite reductase/ring-hydroxylating ferredoxin subunit